MTDIDLRLHHAARRLREMPVEVPSLESLGIDAPAVEPARPDPRPRARVPAGIAAALLLLGAGVGFAAGHADSDDRPLEYAAPTPADRMRDPLPRPAARVLRPADELALGPSATLPRRQVRWS